MAASKSPSTGQVTGLVEAPVTPEVTPEVRRLLCAFTGQHSRRELQERLGLQDDDHMRIAYIMAALAAGLIEMTLPDKPNSRLQEYRLTPSGRAWLGLHSQTA